MSGLSRFHRRLVMSGPDHIGERLLFAILIPLAWLYGVVSWLRIRLYSTGLLRAYHSQLPVLSIGNLAVGGTGKTPVVDWLAKHFLELGKKPVILSRGYGGSFKGKAEIVSDGTNRLLGADQAGDEPRLLADRNPSVPVVISARRKYGLQLIEARFEADIVILDDGFQHCAVKRDFDLVLLDGNSPIGNGLPLPAGNLREFPRALKRADCLLLTRSTGTEPDEYRGLPAYHVHYGLAETARDLRGNIVSVRDLKEMRFVAFAGIAAPEGFFSALEALGLNVHARIAFPDHVSYASKTLATIKECQSGIDGFVTTEKDAVKLDASMFELPCYQIPLTLEIKDGKKLLKLLSDRLWR